MSATALDRDLQTFAVELFERSGGVADWPVPEVPGSVVVPRECGDRRPSAGRRVFAGRGDGPGNPAGRSRGRVSRRGGTRARGGRAARRFVLHPGALPHQPRPDGQNRQTFAWQNARAKCRTAEPALVEYHLWTLLGSLRSEDVWEAIFRVAVNAESQAIVELPDVFQEPDLRGEEPASAADDPVTYATAIAEGKRRLIADVDRVRPPHRTAAGAGPQAAAGLLSSPVPRSRRLEAPRGGGSVTRRNRGQEAGGRSGTAPQAGGIERKLRPAGRVAAGGCGEGPSSRARRSRRDSAETSDP